MGAPSSSSASRTTSHARFSAQVQAAGTTLVTRTLGDYAHLDLTIDFTVLSGPRDRVVVHVLGTHGVEGFAGSAIQSALLQRVDQASSRSNGDGDNDRAATRQDAAAPTVIIAHALNPFG